jgi:hypothetical protein
MESPVLIYHGGVVFIQLIEKIRSRTTNWIDIQKNTTEKNDFSLGKWVWSQDCFQHFYVDEILASFTKSHYKGFIIDVERTEAAFGFFPNIENHSMRKLVDEKTECKLKDSRQSFQKRWFSRKFNLPFQFPWWKTPCDVKKDQQLNSKFWQRLKLDRTSFTIFNWNSVIKELCPLTKNKEHF